MIGILLRTGVNALGLWLAATLIPGITADSTAALIWTAIALGLINAVIRPVIVFLTLPITFITLGLFLLLINAAMLNFAAWFVDDFAVDGFFSSIFGAIVVGLVSWLGSAFIGKNGRYDVMIVSREDRYR